MNRLAKPIRTAGTLADVAREAGVSKNAVSVVLNGAKVSTRVSDATRQRIMDAAGRLKYRPNATAQSLALGRTNTFGVLFSGVQFSPVSSFRLLIYGMICDKLRVTHINFFGLITTIAVLAAISLSFFATKYVDAFDLVAFRGRSVGYDPASAPSPSREIV